MNTVAHDPISSQRPSTRDELLLTELRAVRAEQRDLRRVFDEFARVFSQRAVPLWEAVRQVGSPVMAAAGVCRVLADGQYDVAFPDHGVEFHVDYLRRERHQLVCELAVSCGIVGARAIDGALSIGTFNLSSPQARQSHARILAERARARGVDWGGMLEQLCQFVLTSERVGEPSISLRDVPCRPIAEDDFEILGLRFPRQHPSILFGDGGTLKSYFELLTACTLTVQGLRVGYFDWELDKFTHRQRLEQIAGAEMPDIRYVRCDKPLIHEVTLPSDDSAGSARLRRPRQRGIRQRTEYSGEAAGANGDRGVPGDSADALRPSTVRPVAA